jgi:hypothetical protein
LSQPSLGISLEQLRTAPITEPFDGPALLSVRASAVFFHEVLGHRLEGQRQRGDEEGQTFTKDIGKSILPSFLSVADDPTLATFDGTYLSGYYTYDDEGQRARKVELIQDGVLKTFLMSRQPTASVSSSNGHGRSQPGQMPTGRQGNLIVTSTRTVPESRLRQMLIDEARKQNKPYGLYFEDISSGFAVTTRNAAPGFPGHSARRLSRLHRWPPRRARPRRKHRGHAAGRDQPHPGHWRQARSLQRRMWRRVRHHPGLRHRARHAGQRNRNVETMTGCSHPRTVYRIKVADGSRDLVRGVELEDVNLHLLRSGILAAGTDPYVFNTFGEIPSTVIAPPLLFDDVTLKRTEQRNDKLPYYPPPE